MFRHNYGFVVQRVAKLIKEYYLPYYNKVLLVVFNSLI